MLCSHSKVGEGWVEIEASYVATLEFKIVVLNQHELTED